jgi:predicted DNA-binding mobile mystery protein A
MTKRSAATRNYYDARLERLGLVAGEPRPPRGWIRAIRNSLGLSSRELASRMAVSQATISGLERSEVQGTIKLETLQRAALALECDLLYYFVPRTTLDDTVRAQARIKARQHLASSGRVDDQMGADDHGALLDEIAQGYIDHRDLWSEPPPTPPGDHSYPSLH